MAFIPVNSVAGVDLIFTEHGSRIENTLYFHVDVEMTDAVLLTLAQEVADWWWDSLADYVSSDVILAQVDAVDLGAEDAAGVSFIPATANQGASLAAGLPNNVTLSITFRTLSRGRSFRGRNYFVGLGEDQVTGDIVNSSSAAAIVAGYAALQTHPFSNGANHVVVSRYHNLAPRVAGIYTPVSSYSTDGVIDSQRRRLSGRGV